MIISRTPFRISFFGGGTDYPVWFKEHGGAVLATTIDKYCYLTCRYLPPFFKHKTRIAYSKVELVKTPDEIQHPSAREVLNFLDINHGLEIHHDGDLPARSGLGSSSSFTAGLLNALYAMQGKMVTKEQLAANSIHIEQNLIGENVGSQDQISASYGGFNHITFHPDGRFAVKPVIISRNRLEDLQDHMMLFFTGLSRTASELAEKIIADIPDRTRELTRMREMVDEAMSILNSNEDINNFGKLLHESWKLKRSISSSISNPMLNDLYESALSAGATGGKIIGAGGGGFLVIFARPSIQMKIKQRLKDFLCVPFKFESSGSQIIFYDTNDQYYVYDKNLNGFVYETPLREKSPERRPVV